MVKVYITAIAATLIVVCQCADAQTRSRQEHPWPKFASSGYVPMIPAPITQSEMERYSQILNLSESQKKYVEQWHQGNYTNGCAMIEQRFAEEYLETARTKQRHVKNAPVTYPDYNIVAGEFRRVNEEINLALERSETALFAEIEQILGEAQRPLLGRVKMHRARSRCLPYYNPLVISKAGIDLATLVETQRFRKEIDAELDAVMWQYEQKLTPIRLQLDEWCRKGVETIGEMEQRRNIDEHGRPLDLSNPQTAAQVSERYLSDLVELRRRPTELQKQIAALNDEYVQSFMAQMTQATEADFEREYLTICYRRVYPDATDPISLFDDCMKSSAIDDDLRAVILKRWQSYRDAYERICAQMCRTTDTWQEYAASTGLSDGWREHNEKMVKLAEDRIKKSEDFVQWLTTSLPPAVQQANARSFSNWHNDVFRMRERLARPQMYVDYN